MKFELYTAFGFVAIASAIVALGRIAMGEDAVEVVRVNIVVGGICLGAMLLLFYRKRRQIERRT